MLLHAFSFFYSTFRKQINEELIAFTYMLLPLYSIMNQIVLVFA